MPEKRKIPMEQELRLQLDDKVRVKRNGIKYTGIVTGVSMFMKKTNYVSVKWHFIEQYERIEYCRKIRII